MDPLNGSLNGSKEDAVVHGVGSWAEEVCRTGQSSGGGAASSCCGSFCKTLMHPSVQHIWLHREDQGETFQISMKQNKWLYCTSYIFLKSWSSLQRFRIIYKWILKWGDLGEGDIYSLHRGKVQGIFVLFSFLGLLAILAEAIFSQIQTVTWQHNMRTMLHATWSKITICKTQKK